MTRNLHAPKSTSAAVVFTEADVHLEIARIQGAGAQDRITGESDLVDLTWLAVVALLLGDHGLLGVEAIVQNQGPALRSRHEAAVTVDQLAHFMAMKLQNANG